METLRQRVKEPAMRLFFYLYFIFLAVGLFLNMADSQKELFFWVNSHNTPFLDFFARYYTYAGDGVFCILLGVALLLFTRVRHGLALLCAYATGGILVQVFKQFIFTGRLRPWAMYADKYPIHLVPHFTPYSNNSFPSGHTTTAFSIAVMLILIWPRPATAVLYFILAMLVAYCRIYLSQHYFIDVYVGSVVGTVSSMVIYYYFYKPGKSNLQTDHWLNRRLINLRK